MLDLASGLGPRVDSVVQRAHAPESCALRPLGDARCTSPFELAGSVTYCMTAKSGAREDAPFSAGQRPVWSANQSTVHRRFQMTGFGKSCHSSCGTE
jgi:hypothetical protein